MREKDKCVIINDFEDEVDAFWMIAKLSNLNMQRDKLSILKRDFLIKMRISVI